MTIQGVKIHYTDDVMANHPEMVDWMTDSLTEIERLVPSKAWGEIKICKQPKSLLTIHTKWMASQKAVDVFTGQQDGLQAMEIWLKRKVIWKFIISATLSNIQEICHL